MQIAPAALSKTLRHNDTTGDVERRSLDNDLTHLGRVREITIEIVDAPDEIRNVFSGLNLCAQRLQSLKKRKIDPRPDAIPAVVWQLLSVHQTIVYRAIELQNAVSLLLNEKNFLGALIMARTLVELAAFVSDLHVKVGIGIKENDLAKINAATMAANFATRWDHAPADTKSPNILTLLSHFDRDFAENKAGKPLTEVHAALSEYTHPNWSGMAGFFSVRNNEENTQYFSVQPTDKTGLYARVGIACLSLLVIEFLLGEIFVYATAVRTALLAPDQRAG
jgi:hypothetical protein